MKIYLQITSLLSVKNKVKTHSFLSYSHLPNILTNVGKDLSTVPVKQIIQKKEIVDKTLTPVPIILKEKTMQTNKYSLINQNEDPVYNALKDFIYLIINVILSLEKTF
jgi:hypothetical protein